MKMKWIHLIALQIVIVMGLLCAGLVTVDHTGCVDSQPFMAEEVEEFLTETIEEECSSAGLCSHFLFSIDVLENGLSRRHTSNVLHFLTASSLPFQLSHRRIPLRI